MPELDPSQFFCPHCGEIISKSAKICRFCKHAVTKDLYLLSIPEDTSRGEITKLLMETGPKEIFQSFGQTRKKFEQRGAFVTDVKQEDLEKIIPTLKKFQVQYEEKGRATTSEHKKSFPWSSLIVPVLVAGSGAISYPYLKKLMTRLETANVPVVTTPAAQKNEENLQTSQSARDPLLEQRKKADHANIESLLISTATVMAGNSSGSAFFVSKEGHLISNAHVTTTNKQVGILTFDGKKFLGNVLKTDSYYDLSLIKIDSKDYPPLKLGDATQLHPGDTVWTVGAPHGLSFSVTRGVASFIGRNVGGKSFVQADVAINPGNSGGPMIDDQGEVIGINNFIIQQTQGLNFAIPVNYLYMGVDPILKNVIDTQIDNPTMATWRSWEQKPSEIQSVMSSPNSADSNSTNAAEINKLAAEIKNLDASFKNAQSRNQGKATALQREIDTVNAKYGNAVGISEQEKLGQQMKKLQIELVDLEIANFDEYLRYNKNVAEILQRVRVLSSTDLSAVQQYDSQLQTLARSRTENENQRSAKVEEKKAIQAQNF